MLSAEGHGDVPTRADVETSLLPGSKSSACSHMSLARESGDLGGASPRAASTAGGRQGREGDKQQAALQTSEESDVLVVPKKRTKTWVTPVESVEGRGTAKGKSAARNAYPAQDGNGALTYLQWIGKRAKEKPTEKFTNLLGHIKVPLLKEAYQRLRKDAASGVDGVTWAEYGERLDARLLDLQDRVHRGTYHPQPVRRVHTPKGDGRTRPLGIPALEDKVVLAITRERVAVTK